MSPVELDYLEARARLEQTRAETADDRLAARAHQRLAEEYLRRLEGSVPLGLQLVGKD